MSHEIIELIRVKHRERCYVMEQRKRSDLSLGAFLRLSLGWRRDLEKEQSDRIKDLATKLIDCGEKLAKGKIHDLSDTEEWKDYGEIILASIKAREPYNDIEKKTTKEMDRLAMLLPVWKQFGESIRGFGAGSLAVIIGEAGDLSNYSTHSKLWKRMGLAVMDGRKQGHVAKGLSRDDRKAAFIEHGYSPIRRSRMWNIGDTMVKGNKDGPYRSAYLARKQHERDRAEANGLTVAPSAKIPEKRKDEFMSDGHIHLRAQRYLEKRLLRDLWKAWRRAIGLVAERPMPNLLAGEITDAAQAAGQASAVMPLWADDCLPDHLLPDAPQGAGEARNGLPEKANTAVPRQLNAAQAAGEAVLAVPARARTRLPPHQSRDAAEAAGEARQSVHEKANWTLPRRKSKKAPQGAGEAVNNVPLAGPALPPHQFVCDELHVISHVEIPKNAA